MDLSIDKFGQGEASIIARNGPAKSLGKHEFKNPLYTALWRVLLKTQSNETPR